MSHVDIDVHTPGGESPKEISLVFYFTRIAKHFLT